MGKRRRGRRTGRRGPVDRRSEVELAIVSGEGGGTEVLNHAQGIGPVETVVTAYRIGADACEVLAIEPSMVADWRSPGEVLWLDVQGTAAVEFINGLGAVYGLHPLAVEDVLHPHQRAKVESYPGHRLFVARMIHYGEVIELEQLALFIGRDFVITVQEGISDGDPFARLRRRLIDGTHRPATVSAELLAHALLDAVVDDYGPALEAFGERLDNLEDEVIAGRRDVLPRIQQARHDIVTVRRALWPLRDALFALGREGFALASDTRLYLRDTTDHLLRLLEVADGHRETVSSMMELHLSTLSQRLNETMRFLAVISTIFIPLTFIAGVYGMNFDPEVSPLNMPELKSPVGYPVVLVVMIAVGVGLLWYFRRRGWLGSR